MDVLLHLHVQTLKEEGLCKVLSTFTLEHPIKERRQRRLPQKGKLSQECFLQHGFYFLLTTPTKVGTRSLKWFILQAEFVVVLARRGCVHLKMAADLDGSLKFTFYLPQPLSLFLDILLSHPRPP